MWGGGEKGLFLCVCVCVCVFMCFDIVLFCIFFDILLKLICVLFIIFQRFLGPLTTSEIILFVTLFNGFRPWTNVSKIYILDVVEILE